MITSVLAFIIAFGLLVLVHEFGHFWVARRAGIACEKFSIGFGPKLFGFKWKETDFCISLLPLGGFVKLKGEGEEQEVSPDDKTAFPNKSVAARSAVVIAGPVMNLVLSFALMPLVFWIGKPQPSFFTEPAVIERIIPGSPAEKAGFQVGDQVIQIESKPVTTWENLLETLALTASEKELSVDVQRGNLKQNILVKTAALPGGEGAYLGFEKFFGKSPQAEVKDVIAGSPAEYAGIRTGDLITEIDGKPVGDWDSLIQSVNTKGGEIFSVGILRQTSKLALKIKPNWDESAKRWMMGIRGPEGVNTTLFSTKRYEFFEAIQMGFKTNVKNIALTFEVLKRLFTFQMSYKNLGGPVQIAYTLAKASASGLADFLYFTAFLSLQLAILNILPIPMLDGGHLVFFGIEAIRKRPLGLKARLISQQIGLALLLTLILLVTVNDLERVFGLVSFIEKLFR
ncbi:MAG: RIP metalloprotease RseP [Deltaproteobacteria bacterium RIFCSPLOWO2_12_FULL_44_12]|nr:MAG: RIP metalloprotease RseP [Deltaproteobacteria bacterium RIFCSPHIGHO2_01_FULL_43_49]OGQ15463.1 MAG: RIP metalloprotease RseP [Deltaproteobacteria bacterium RIFCSPHIGHO2_02_FULL_44_53]OGQ29656.1 MAG: RIP metalloprotease RseP [Deltaproteobacteria bacterium RIFCSPHIGHO2_12_FULL_44_21]OGQ32269.1 MAG: RIP metalloprotease RseP [Deltaproteobacteria bacterium RIFCSPLOWO2_01_FULL_45_74]OGQ43912.1 MAG: RIP metalloprotease RseP [Deltaproteobacteria bacterium RIFCSPLOWO2_02_FULL_44_34]OGQ70966.1 MA